MKLTGNTVLITGGSSGIGLELSKQLIQRGNKVIICGRSVDKLETAKRQLPDLETIQCDLADRPQCYNLADTIKSRYPQTNVLINNAAIVNNTEFIGTTGIMDMAETEIAVNFLAPLCLINALHSTLIQNQNPTVVNVTTGLVYAPRAVYPFYNSTKAALHAFTQVLREQSEGSDLTVVEVLFPVVDTPWHQGNPPKIAISAEKAVSGMLKAMHKDKHEIRVGATKLIYLLSRIAPGFAFRKINSLKRSKMVTMVSSL